MLTLTKKSVLALDLFAIMPVQFVASHSCQNTSLVWSTHSIPWHVKHDPIKNFETIVPLPPFSYTSESTDGACD
jgi:hypothetical protein